MNPVLLWFHQLGSPPIFDRFATRWAPCCYAIAFVFMGTGLWQAFQVP
ncbi:MAG: heme ABC transporter permease, partial [Pseudoxanthomonas sp.]